MKPADRVKNPSDDTMALIEKRNQGFERYTAVVNNLEKKGGDEAEVAAYSDDSDQAIEVILNVAQADPRVLKDPEPWVRLTNLGESSVDLTARIWCKAEDYWELKFALTKNVKAAFDATGISIPYQHTVEISKAG